MSSPVIGEGGRAAEVIQSVKAQIMANVAQLNNPPTHEELLLFIHRLINQNITDVFEDPTGADSIADALPVEQCTAFVSFLFLKRYSTPDSMRAFGSPASSLDASGRDNLQSVKAEKVLSLYALIFPLLSSPH